MDEKRFELRRNTDGSWSIIDRQSGEAAFIDGIVFKDLALDVAQAAAQFLNVWLKKPPTRH